MKIGLSLSGGGVMGAAHVGVIKALHEEGIDISMVSGTSAGAIVASLFAAGYGANELWDIFLNYDTDCTRTMHNLNKGNKRGSPKIIDIDYAGLIKYVIGLLFGQNFSLKGILKGNAIEDALKQYCTDKGVCYLKDIKMPFAITAVDLNTFSTVYFSNQDFKGSHTDYEIYKAVRASISYPVVFQPCHYGECLLVDGGLSNNNPVDVLKEMGSDFIIAVDLGNNITKRVEINNIIEVAEYSLSVTSYYLSKYLTKNADFIISPNIEGVSLLDASKIEMCMSSGYEIAKKLIPRIKSKLSLRNNIISITG